MLTSYVDVVYQHDLDLKFEIRYHFFHFEVEIHLIVNLYIMKVEAAGLSQFQNIMLLNVNISRVIERHSDHYKTKSLKSNFYLYDAMHIDKQQNV